MGDFAKTAESMCFKVAYNSMDNLCIVLKGVDLAYVSLIQMCVRTGLPLVSEVNSKVPVFKSGVSCKILKSKERKGLQWFNLFFLCAQNHTA